MYQDIIKAIRPELEKALSFYSTELGRLRTGQASPAIVEDIPVDLFGQKMTVKQLAAISCPERRQIVVQPWDMSYISPIEKALQKSEIGVSPVVDQNIIRIILPPLTQEFRQNLIRLLAEKTEQTKKTMRKWRDEAWGKIQDEAKEGKIREDDKFKGKDELQKLIDEYDGKVEELKKRKEGEIQTN